MRYASFSASAAEGGKIDISVVTFPGDGGNDVDNINRWREQMGLAPADANAVSSQVAPLKTGETSSPPPTLPEQNAHHCGLDATRRTRLVLQSNRASGGN